MPSPSDEYLGRLLRALERVPEERVTRVVDEAWAEAEAGVRETLTTAMRAALLRRTVALLEDDRSAQSGSETPQSGYETPRATGRTPSTPRSPSTRASPAPPAEDAGEPPGVVQQPTGTEGADRAPVEQARYVYGITPGGAATLPPDLAGIDPRFPVEVISRGGLDAITSTVTTAEFGPDALRERLADRGWLEEKVRIHEDVVRRGLEAEALVPMRFCTIVRDAEGLAGFLEKHGARLRRTLGELAGRREWGVTVSTVPERFEEHVRAASEESRQLDARAESEGAGTAYFLEKRRQQLLEDEGERIASAAAGAWHERLARVAAGAVVLPPRRRGEDDERPGTLVLNGAYLVDRAAEEEFARTVEEIAGEGRATGLAVALTGPWPAYSFVDDDVGAEATG